MDPDALFGAWKESRVRYVVRKPRSDFTFVPAVVCFRDYCEHLLAVAVVCTADGFAINEVSGLYLRRSPPF